MFVKTLKNKNGMSLLGTLIAAAVGLIVTMGLSKALVNFSEQTTNLARRGDMNIIKQNLVAKLKDTTIWKASKNKLSCVPGKNCDISLFDVDRNGAATANRWVCKRKGGNINQGVIIMAQNGLTQPLNCSSCASDIACGFDPKKFIRAEIESVPNDLSDLARPSYSGYILDTVRSKKMIELDVLSSSEELTDEEQVKCPNGSFLVRVEEGKPICEKNNVALINNGCSASQFLVGFNSNGGPICRDNDQGVKNKACPAGKVLVAFNVYGNPICRDDDQGVKNKQCPSGSYLKGFNINGDPICLAVTVQSCPSGYYMAGMVNQRAVCKSLASAVASINAGTPPTYTWHLVNKCSDSIARDAKGNCTCAHTSDPNKTFPRCPVEWPASKTCSTLNAVCVSWNKCKKFKCY